jgi:hypothetical protein
MFAFQGDMVKMEMLGVPGVYLTRKCVWVPMSNISEISVEKVTTYVEPEPEPKPVVKKKVTVKRRGRPKKAA